jgi:hypothetical protein
MSLDESAEGTTDSRNSLMGFRWRTPDDFKVRSLCNCRESLWKVCSPNLLTSMKFCIPSTEMGRWLWTVRR